MLSSVGITNFLSFALRNGVWCAKHLFTPPIYLPMPAQKSAPPSPSRQKLSAHHRGGATESMEDYLEAIADIVASQGFVRVSDVAERLDIRRASVSLMIKRLGQLGYLNHVPYRGFTLTAQGEKLAARIKERHETLTEFFSLLGLPAGALERDVEGIEHHVSGDTLRLLHRFISFWKANPKLAASYAAHRD